MALEKLSSWVLFELCVMEFKIDAQAKSGFVWLCLRLSLGPYVVEPVLISYSASVHPESIHLFLLSN
jgi:hypothetical protein